MTASSSELAREFNSVTGTIAELRDDLRLPCPNGYICEGVQQAECSRIRDLFQDPNRFGLGDVLAGMWCPRGENALQNCTVRSEAIVPTSNKSRIPCPAGTFCPHKVRRNPGHEACIYRLPLSLIFFFRPLFLGSHVLDANKELPALSQVALDLLYWRTSSYWLFLV
jgi:hypothetical protein